MAWVTMSGSISWLIAAKIPVITFLVAAAVGFLAIGIGAYIARALLNWILGVVISVLRGDVDNSFRNPGLYDNGLDTFLYVVGSIDFAIALFIGTDAYHNRPGDIHLFPDLFYDALELFGDFLPLSLVIVSLLLMYENLTRRGFKDFLVYTLLILTVGFGGSIGISFATGHLSSALLLALVGTGLPLAVLSLAPAIQQNRLVAKYRQSKELLVKP